MVLGSLALLDPNSSLFLVHLLFYCSCRSHCVVASGLHSGGAAFKFTSKALCKGLWVDLVARSLLPEAALQSLLRTSFQDAPEKA